MRRILLPLFSLLIAAAPAIAEPTFSIDFQGPTPGAADGFALGVITEGDILTKAPGPPGPNAPAAGPLPLPGIEVGGPAGAAGAVPGGLGIAPGPTGQFELDALSYGKDVGDILYFSVDEFAIGVAGPAAPNVLSEGADTFGATEASADVFRYLGLLAPTPPGAVIGNTAHIDGNGVAPSGLAGLGIVEPNPSSTMSIPDPGDNLDAVDLDTSFADLTGLIFFSLDSDFGDPLDGFPANSGTAAFNGFSGADVLVSAAGGAPALAIPAAALGLDLLGGFDSDDLDALIFDDADGSLTLTAGDTIYFSVRRGSAVIGAPDSLFGVPIEEGDVLTLPTGAGLLPAIAIAAEVIGLTTNRSFTSEFGYGDELDALDVLPGPEVPAMGPFGHTGLALALAGVAWLLRGTRRFAKS